MFSGTRERTTRSVQVLLFAGWLAIIGSLFFDPFTPGLTSPDNVESPFRIKEGSVDVRGEAMPNEPYALTARLFWAMVIPVLPLFFMLFGHEAWRRVCPLSFASQIPRFLGLQRYRMLLQRRSGQIEKAVALPLRNGWMHRNAWYVQFFLLFVGLTARLLVLNSERELLGAFLIGVIVCAIVVGLLWGGKTWCNYFCPVNVVQKIYTEPGGILESKPHRTRIPISQSTCRTLSDKSSCVGCTPNCADIDLERSYWESITDPRRRHVYYMFLGLVVAFYGYYYLYAGNWDYYFSGIWTHEAGLLARLTAPGFYLLGQSYAVPKLVAAPLTLAVGCVGGLALGLLLENAYRHVRARMDSTISEAEIVNHCLCFSAYVTINVFYAFGGRPNMLLLPEPVFHGITALVVLLSTLWFWKAVRRTPRRYRREGLASSLIGQLKRMKVDLSSCLDGRKLEELSPDEVYMLTEALPAFSRAQKLQAYKQVLDDAVTSGKTRSALSLQLLNEMRVQMNITEDEHAKLLAELDTGDDVNLDVQAALAKERDASLASYAEIVGSALTMQVESGRPLEALLQDPQMKSTISVMRASFHITDAEHDAMMRRLRAGEGKIFACALENLQTLNAVCSARLCMQDLAMREPNWRPFAEVLAEIAETRMNRTMGRLFCLMRAFGDPSLVRWVAYNAGVLMSDLLEDALSRSPHESPHATWREVFDAETIALLCGDDEEVPSMPTGAPSGATQLYTFREAMQTARNVSFNLDILAVENDPIAMAMVLPVLAHVDPPAAVELEASVRKNPQLASHWLLADVVQHRASAPREGIAPDFEQERVPRFMMLVWLLRFPQLARYGLVRLARITDGCEVRRYARNTVICREGEPAAELFALQDGAAEAQSTTSAEAKPVAPLTCIGEIDAGPRYRATVRITSERATVIVVPADAVRQLATLTDAAFEA